MNSSDTIYSISERSYLSLEYLSENERNITAGARTRLQQVRSPALRPLHNEDNANTFMIQ